MQFIIFIQKIYYYYTKKVIRFTLVFILTKSLQINKKNMK